MLIAFYFIIKYFVLPEILGNVYPLATMALDFAGIYLVLAIGIAILFNLLGIKSTGTRSNSVGISAIVLAIVRAGISLGRWLIRIIESITRATYNSLHRTHPVAAWLVSILVVIILI